VCHLPLPTFVTMRLLTDRIQSSHTESYEVCPCRTADACRRHVLDSVNQEHSRNVYETFERCVVRRARVRCGYNMAMDYGHTQVAGPS